MRLRRDKTGDAMGQPSWRLSFLGDADAKLFCGSEQTRRDESEILPHPGLRFALNASPFVGDAGLRSDLGAGGD